MTDKGSKASLPAEDLQAIVEGFNASHWRSMELEFHGTRLFLSKDAGASPEWAAPAAAARPTAAMEGPATPASSAPPAASCASAPPAGDTAVSGQIVVKAPSLGTFYRSPKPGAAPFIELNAQVDADTELCLIEVMKLFTTLRAGVKGKLVDILVKDGEMVEFDQPIFVIDTNG